MTITFNCATLQCNSSNLFANNQQVVVNLYKNCEATPSLTYTFGTVPTSTYTLNASSFGVASFPSGVWKVENSIKKVDGSILKEFTCYYLDCDDLICEYVTDFIASPEKALAYEALKASNTCTQCSCSDMCSFNNVLNQTTTTNGCGCQ